MRTDDYFQPCSTVQRAIDEAKAALEAKGYELVPFEHPRGLYGTTSIHTYMHTNIQTSTHTNTHIYIHMHTHIQKDTVSIL